jgi:hypothetical protein
MLLQSMPVGAIPLESTDEQQHSTAGKSPVDVVAKIRKDLAEFQQNSSKQALRRPKSTLLR